MKKVLITFLSMLIIVSAIPIASSLNKNHDNFYDFKLLYTSLSTYEGIPDLDCSGSLSWTNVDPGAKVYGDFEVENIGDPTSELDWEVKGWPSWGTNISIGPCCGENLTPEDGPVTVDISLEAPNEYGLEYTGYFKVVNLENPSDYEKVPVSLTTRELGSDLECTGTLNWDKVKPGEELSGSIIVKNDGIPGSELDWEVKEWPNWGEWTFTPPNGDNLRPEDGPVTVDVKVIAPNEKNAEFNGKVEVVNLEYPTDKCIIQVTLTTPKNKSFIFNFPVLNWLFERFPNAFLILRYVLGF